MNNEIEHTKLSIIFITNSFYVISNFYEMLYKFRGRF